MMLLLLLALKQFVEQFIKKFCSVFVFQKRPSIKCAAQSFSIFSSGKILSDSNFCMGFVWMLCVYVWPYSKGLWYLAINFQLYHYVIILIDVQRLGISMSFWTNELRNFWKLFCFGLSLLFLEKKIIKCPITLN